MSVRIAVNGFGRIGRCLVRAWLESGRNDLEIVAINDPGDPDVLALLLAYDSTHGPLGQSVTAEGGSLRIGEREIRLLTERDPAALPWKELQVDVVLECSGIFRKRDELDAHLQAGAGRVLLGAPAKDELDCTVVYGINHQDLVPAHRLASNASCTTNCLAPVLAPIHRSFEVLGGMMTTIHAYTNDQMLIDAPHSDARRARSGTQSMIPTSTGATRALGKVLPELDGLVNGYSMRVPTLNVSCVDLTLRTSRQPGIDEVNACLRQAAAGEFSGVLALNDQPLVSIDFNHHPASAIFDATQTMTVDGLLKVLAWYDNEWGYANRMLDVGVVMGQL